MILIFWFKKNSLLWAFQSKVEEFLTLVSNTLNSYVITYKSEWPGGESEESQFVHALCGVITS